MSKEFLPRYNGFANGDGPWTSSHSFFTSYNVNGSSHTTSLPNPRYDSNGRYGANLRIAPWHYPDEFENADLEQKFQKFTTNNLPPRGRRASVGSNETHSRFNTSTASRHQTSHQNQSWQATPADAFHHGIPRDYSLTNWDPTKSPIILLGSVFDANSLGKWIYDWTVFCHEAGTPISDVAGDLWLLLINVSGKMRRGEEGLRGENLIRGVEARELVLEFVEAGEKLMERLGKLLKACEGPMLRAEKKKREKAVLEQNAGVKFVETLFGREGMLEGTERFMTSCRLWIMRWDANCEEIVRNPTALVESAYSSLAE